MLIEGRFERSETNPMHFKWEVTWTHENQPDTFYGAAYKQSLRLFFL